MTGGHGKVARHVAWDEAPSADASATADGGPADLSAVAFARSGATLSCRPFAGYGQPLQKPPLGLRIRKPETGGSTLSSGFCAGLGASDCLVVSEWLA
jgi:hypothetical protein